MTTCKFKDKYKFVRFNALIRHYVLVRAGSDLYRSLFLSSDVADDAVDGAPTSFDFVTGRGAVS